MFTHISRGRAAIGTSTLAFIAAMLTACSDQPQTTAPPRSLQPRFGIGDVITVTNTSGGTELGSLRWALSLVTGGEIVRFDP